MIIITLLSLPSAKEFTAVHMDLLPMVSSGRLHEEIPSGDLNLSLPGPNPMH